MYLIDKGEVNPVTDEILKDYAGNMISEEVGAIYRAADGYSYQLPERSNTCIQRLFCA